MPEQAISSETARRIYDWFGGRYDWFEFYEARARERARHWLDLGPGLQVLEAGVGTGKFLKEIRIAVKPDGLAVGVDLSRVMLDLARRKGALVCEADVRHLPLVGGRFDRVYAAYLLDLLPTASHPGVIEGFRRVLRPGGRLVVLSLTEGVDLPSRAVTAAWKAAYAISPVLCAGCRPLTLQDAVEDSDLELEEREVVVQFGVASEIVVARRV